MNTNKNIDILNSISGWPDNKYINAQNKSVQNICKQSNKKDLNY